MLGKLMKYDFKALFKYFIPMSIFILVYSCFGTLLFKAGDPDAFSGDTLINVLRVLVLVAYIIMIIAYCLITQGIIVVNFYKSMVTDTGYLTHTLPVKKSTLLASKMITGCVTLLISYFILLCCLVIMLDVPTNMVFYKNELREAFELGNHYIGAAALTRFILSVLFAVLIGTVQSLSMYFVSIALGQLINRHKIVGSLVSFFAITFGIQIFSTIISFFVGGIFETIDKVSLNYFSMLCSGSSLLMLALSAIMLFVTNYIFSNKLNLG